MRHQADRPTVSVILPTFNRAPSLGEAIDSVLGQSTPADQVIVVDDGSTDGTAAVLARYGRRIEVVRQDNRGVNLARNRGLDLARGDWIAFQDSDDVWLPHRLEVLHRDIAGAPGTIVAHAANLTVDGIDFHRDWLDHHGEATAPSLAVARPFLFAMRGCYMQSMALRRSAMGASLRFDPRATPAGDTNFFAKLAMLGPWLVARDTVARVRRLPDDATAVSARGHSAGLRRRLGEIYSYESLGGLPLTAPERRALNDRLALLYFGLSEAEGAQRQTGAALRHLLKAARSHPNPLKGWAKATLCLALGERGYDIATGRQRA